MDSMRMTMGDMGGSPPSMGNMAMSNVCDTMKSYIYSSTSGDFYFLSSGWCVQSQGAMVGATFTTIAFAAGVHFVSAILRRRASAKHSALLPTLIGGFCEGATMFGHYILMLLAMSFNIFILISLLFGHGLGYVAYRYAFPDRGPAMGVAGLCSEEGCGAPVAEAAEEGGLMKKDEVDVAL
ncbi:hypothetical protein TrCOL_g11685 [Triparma columacea]|uniref:Copper transport protein n=1 Tax=Triparma columacea TaxID=722753 RepID=A0A9W7GGP7_9STRA|nr:hypothetical protein TrCOL_g11685 [Triparma columacea]